MKIAYKLLVVLIGMSAGGVRISNATVVTDMLTGQKENKTSASSPALLQFAQAKAEQNIADKNELSNVNIKARASVEAEAKIIVGNTTIGFTQSDIKVTTVVPVAGGVQMPFTMALSTKDDYGSVLAYYSGSYGEVTGTPYRWGKNDNPGYFLYGVEWMLAQVQSAIDASSDPKTTAKLQNIKKGLSKILDARFELPEPSSTSSNKVTKVGVYGNDIIRVKLADSRQSPYYYALDLKTGYISVGYPSGSRKVKVEDIQTMISLVNGYLNNEKSPAIQKQLREVTLKLQKELIKFNAVNRR